MMLIPKESAVLLIEYQNDFVSEGGVFHDAVKGVMETNKMLDNTVAFVKAARDRGAQIIHSPITFAKGYYEITQHPYGILKGVVDNKAFIKDGWGASFAESMTPAEGDIVIEGKRGLDAFASTNLDFILRSRGVKNLIIGGFLTNCCVESTMRTGYENGFNVVTLTDCCATVSQEQHDAALNFDFPMFSHPMTHDKALEAFG